MSQLSLFGDPPEDPKPTKPRPEPKPQPPPEKQEPIHAKVASVLPEWRCIVIACACVTEGAEILVLAKSKVPTRGFAGRKFTACQAFVRRHSCRAYSGKTRANQDSLRICLDRNVEVSEVQRDERQGVPHTPWWPAHASR